MSSGSSERPYLKSCNKEQLKKKPSINSWFSRAHTNMCTHPKSSGHRKKRSYQSPHVRNLKSNIRKNSEDQAGHGPSGMGNSTQQASEHKDAEIYFNNSSSVRLQLQRHSVLSLALCVSHTATWVSAELFIHRLHSKHGAQQRKSPGASEDSGKSVNFIPC